MFYNHAVIRVMSEDLLLHGDTTYRSNCTEQIGALNRTDFCPSQENPCRK